MINEQSRLAIHFWETGKLGCPILDFHAHMHEYAAVYFPANTADSMAHTMDRYGTRWTLFCSHLAMYDPINGEKYQQEACQRFPNHFRAYHGVISQHTDPEKHLREVGENPDTNLYRYLVRQGVAGRWSYMYHPKIFNDHDCFYLQRVSRDQLRSLIIFRHKPTEKIHIFPRGLLKEQVYQITFQNRSDQTCRSGQDLMDNGLVLDTVSDGELIYLNLSDRPGSGLNTRLPEAPSRVLCHYDHNIGYEGVSIDWTSCPDSEQVTGYEILRSGKILAQVVVGHYWFDREPGCLYTSPELC